MLARLHDPLLAVLSVGLVALLLLLTRAIQRRWQLSPPAHRKLLHATIGSGTLAMTVLFHSRGWASVPPALFTAANFSPRIRAFLPGVQGDSKDALGLWLFPLGVLLTYLLFWNADHRGAVLAGIAALAFADPAAALVGTRLGQRRFERWAHGRTLEGSLAFLVVAGVSSAIVAAALPGGPSPVRIGVGCGLVGAAAEALSPSGYDNLAVPILVAAAYRLLA